MIIKMVNTFPSAFQIDGSSSFEVESIVWHSYGKRHSSHGGHDEAVKHAVLNHDRLTEENKALKADRDNAISKMSKSWQHNADDHPDLLSRFVDMANRQFEERDALREALRNLVSSASDNEEQLNDVLMCSDYGESKALCDARKILAKINKV